MIAKYIFEYVMLLFYLYVLLHNMYNKSIILSVLRKE